MFENSSIEVCLFGSEPSSSLPIELASIVASSSFTLIQIVFGMDWLQLNAKNRIVPISPGWSEQNT